MGHCQHTEWCSASTWWVGRGVIIDKYLVSVSCMAIFGDDILWNGTTFYRARTADRVWDHVFVVLSIALLIISCICNPIVFWFHRRMKQNTPAVLFQILTANDFLTCILVVPVMVYYLIAGVSPYIRLFEKNCQ